MASYGKSNENIIDHEHTAKAFDAAYGHPDALKRLAGAADQFFKSLDVPLSGPEQKYVLTYLVAMSASGKLFDPGIRPMVQDPGGRGIVAVQ
jgi:hypothetical protein